MTVLSAQNYCMDTSTIGAFQELTENDWLTLFPVFSTRLAVNIARNPDDILDFFYNHMENANYKVFYGNSVYLWNSVTSVRFTAAFGSNNYKAVPRYEDEIMVSGERSHVENLVKAFKDHFRNDLISKDKTVDWVSMTSNGLDYTTMPIKTRQVIHPEFYPYINGGDIDGYIDDFFASSSNVLIFTGEPGLGKSALINHLILRGTKKTQVVYDTNVMYSDRLYTDFINKSISENGGLMIMEDADIILTSREASNNEMMSKLLNLADGILDSSVAKFVFSANIRNIKDIDEALTRPGRCYDIQEFQRLTYDQAVVAAAAIGKELTLKQDSYTVAEIYNDRTTKENTRSLTKFGFV